MNTIHTLAEQSGSEQIPVIIRVYLWGAAGMAIIICLIMAMAFCAGPAPKDGNHWRPFTTCALVLMCVHAGYLLGPLAAGTGWWKWAFWLMAPMGTLVVLGTTFPMLQSLQWTPPDGGSRLPGLMRMGTTAVVASALYAGPPLALWWVRPAAKPVGVATAPSGVPPIPVNG